VIEDPGGNVNFLPVYFSGVHISIHDAGDKLARTFSQNEVASFNIKG